MNRGCGGRVIVSAGDDIVVSVIVTNHREQMINQIIISKYPNTEPLVAPLLRVSSSKGTGPPKAKI